jgi:uncharacterized membrane protein YfcA
MCALGILIGGYFGGLIAIDLPSNVLRALFGLFLMLSAYLLWRKSKPRAIAPASGGSGNA